MASPKDYIKLHFIVFLWGFSAILGKLIAISAIEMIWYRALLSIIGVAAVIYVSRGTFRTSGADMVKLLGIGAIVAIHWIAFFGSARISNVSVSLVGFATNSLWAALLDPWFRRERVKRYELILGFIVVIGLYVITSFNFQYQLGLLISVFGGFTCAVFSVLNARMVTRVSARTITFYEMIGIALFTGLCLPFGNLVGMDTLFPALPSASDVLYIAILAGACSVYAYTAVVDLLKRLPVFTIQLTLNLEPIYGIVAALLIFGQQEKMTFNFYVGTLLILAAVIAYPIVRKRYDPPVVID